MLNYLFNTTPEEARPSTKEDENRQLRSGIHWRNIIILAGFLIILVGLSFVLRWLTGLRPDIWEALIVELVGAFLVLLGYDLIAQKGFIRLIGTEASREIAGVLRPQFESLPKSIEPQVQQIRQEIIGGGQVLTAEIMATINNTINNNFSYFYPTATYEPTDDPDPRINAHITRDFARTSNYAFRGVSGKYVAARVKNERRDNISVRVIILDPQDPVSLQRRIIDRKNTREGGGKDEEAMISREILDETYMSIIALYDCSRTCGCKVEIVCGTGTTVSRLEIFDQSIYISIYPDRAANNSGDVPEFPRTVRFTSDSFFYRLCHSDYKREFEKSSKHFIFELNTNEEYLRDCLQQMGMICYLVHLGKLRFTRPEWQKIFLDYSYEQALRKIGRPRNLKQSVDRREYEQALTELLAQYRKSYVDIEEELVRKGRIRSVENLEGVAVEPQILESEVG